MIKRTGIMSDVDVNRGSVSLTSNHGQQTHNYSFTGLHRPCSGPEMNVGQWGVDGTVLWVRLRRNTFVMFVGVEEVTP